MNRALAVSLFLAVCILLAALLLVQAIRPPIGGALFAVALLILGGLSRGFTRTSG